MKLFDKAGVLLFAVESATAEGIDCGGLFGVEYMYTCGGARYRGDIVRMHRHAMEFYHENPGSYIEGLLPEPKL